MLKSIWQSLSFFIIMTLILGLAYPALVTTIASRDGDKDLLAQPTSDPKLFWSRPTPASNLGPTSEALRVQIRTRRELLGADAPTDLLTASASGLDPHISPQAARFQIARIAAARDMDVALLEKLVNESIEKPQWGFMGQPRVNVAKLNRQLP